MPIFSSTYCTAPFSTVRIDLFNGRPTLKPGCIYRSSANINTLEEYIQGKEMTALRQSKICETEPVLACQGCWQNEQQGKKSIRQFLLQKPWVKDQPPEQIVIRLLDIFYSNVCNLACFMCSPGSSTYLAQERYNIGLLDIKPEIQNQIDFALEFMEKLQDLESVSLIGGEFFVTKKNIRLLDAIIKRNLALRIVTNASVLSNELFDKISQVKNLEIQVSMDDIGQGYEFMRYPAKWVVFCENLARLKSIPNVRLNLMAVPQILNLQNLINIVVWANQQKISITFEALVGNATQNLSWSVLTSDEKNILSEALAEKLGKERMLSLKQKQEIQTYIDALRSSTHVLEHRKNCIDLLGKTLCHRQYPKDLVKNQFGLLSGLAADIIKCYNE